RSQDPHVLHITGMAHPETDAHRAAYAGGRSRFPARQRLDDDLGVLVGNAGTGCGGLLAWRVDQIHSPGDRAALIGRFARLRSLRGSCGLRVWLSILLRLGLGLLVVRLFGLLVSDRECDFVGLGRRLLL